MKNEDTTFDIVCFFLVLGSSRVLNLTSGVTGTGQIIVGLAVIDLNGVSNLELNFQAHKHTHTHNKKTHY
jgi:hypothetical protein